MWPPLDEWIQEIWYIYTHNGLYSAIKKIEILPLFHNMDGLSQYYTKWNKSDRDRQIPYNLTHMWNTKTKKLSS